MRVVIATGNAGKLREFERILEPLGFEVIAQANVCRGMEVEETGETFAENAYLKAQAVHTATGLAAIADDSGLCVDALDGRPGVHTARYGGDLPYPEKQARLLGELGGIPVDWRTAKFVAHICFLDADGTRIDAEGICPGYIGDRPRGENGFGYDPIFMVGDRSMSELSDAEKDTISHRGRALRDLVAKLKEKNKC